MRASISFVRLSRRAAVLTLVLLMAAVSYAQITPSQDSYTNTASPATNYGVAVTLGVVNSAASIQTTYIQFDLSSIPAGYKSSNIAKAMLKLYVNAVTTAGSFNIDFVNGTWTEKKVTSNLAPALGTTIMSSVPLTSANGKNYLLLDITSAVGAWLDATQANDGIALVANSPLSATFDSKENTLQSQPPEIDIVFAGGGSITGVTTSSGSGLMGGGTSGTLNLSLTNSCAANQILQWNGTAWVCANMGGGASGVSSVGLTAPSTDFLVTGSPVTTSGTLGLAWLVAPDFNDTPNAIVKRDSSGNFSAGSINAATGFNLGSYPFAFGSYVNGNAFLGFAGNATMTGSTNTASGYQALAADTTGNSNTVSGAYALEANTTGIQNTASGVEALTSNTTGGFNTASGYKALLANTTGNNNTASGTQALYYNTGGANNTALGYSAGPDQNSANLTNATAIGAYAVVSESNALVLGGTGGNAVSVGIGTATPAYTLDVQGTGNFTGLVKFASGQTFPGAGTIKGVTTAAGSGLTGGGTSGTLNLSLVKTCTSGQVLAWNGTAWVCTTVSSGGGTITGVTAGTDLTGGGTIGNVTLNLDTTKVPQLVANNTYTGTQTINNIVTVTASGSSYGLSATSGITGVYGSGQTEGVYGAGGGVGVYGSGVNTGVYGNANASTGTGVYGYGSAYGLYGYGSGSSGTGVYGSGSTYGVYGTGTATGNGYNSGVYGSGSGAEGSGVYGSGAYGVYGTGVQGVTGSGSNFGLAGYGSGSSSTGVYGQGGTGSGGYGGYFYGDVQVTGAITAGTKDFKIDHPLDPANKYLYHASVESSEMKNIYDGVVTTDAQGEAMVQLADWFEALNTDFRYQLTVIGQFAQAIVSSEIANHQFRIKTDKPNVKVSWQVTGIRQDAYAKAHPIILEAEKAGDEKGKYLYPVEHGQPKEMGIDENRRAKMLALHPMKPPKPPQPAAAPEPPK